MSGGVFTVAVDTGDVERAAAGDRQAYARLVERTRSLVSSLALATLRDVAASEDVAQEVFIAVWRDLRTLRNPKSFLPWIRQLTRHRALDAVRRTARRAARPGGTPPGPTLDALADPRPADAAQEITPAEHAALEAALEELPTDERELLALYYREGGSVAQVAALLGLRPAAAKKRLQRARDTLRSMTLEKLGELLERTTPGAAFSAAVLAGLATVAPSTATAATLGLGAAPKLAVGAGASGLGAVLGVLGVVGSVARISRHARDERERKALRRFAWINGAVTALAAVVMPLAALRFHAVGLVVSFLLSFGFIARGYFVTLPGVFAAGPRTAELVRALRQTRILVVAGGTVSAVMVAWLAWQLGL